MKKYILLFIIPVLWCFSIHKYYVALTEIEYKEESKSVQMIMNVFIDDIETVLNNEYQINAQLTDHKEIKNINNYFEKYLNEHFKITINNQSKKYDFIGKEYDGNIVYFYLEINDVLELKNIFVENTMFLTYFPEQQNIIKFKANKIKESFFLTQKKDKALLKF